MAEEKYEDVVKKVNENGIDSLTLDEKKILRFKQPENEKMIDSDKYSELEVSSIKERQKSGSKLTDDEQAVLLGKEIDNKNEIIDIVVNGQNDTWFKHYDYSKDGGPTFDISIKVPTIGEEGRIATLVQKYLGGTAVYWDAYTTSVYHGLALIQVCGRNIPKEFADPDKIYNVSAGYLHDINEDFVEWENRFRL